MFINTKWFSTSSALILFLLLIFPCQLHSQPYVAISQPTAVHSAIACSYMFGMSTPVSGAITTNTTWTAANSPYIVTGDITVNAGVTLTIEPCTLIKFDGNYKIIINGTLTAQGAATKKIRFQSNLSPAAPGDWIGIYFPNISNDASIISHSEINHAATAVETELSSPTITHNDFRNNKTAIKQSYNSASSITYNLFDNNTEYAIAIFGSISNGLPHPVVHNNLFLNNTLYDFFCGPTNYNQSGDIIDARYNWWGTADPLQISASIWDGSDAIWRPKVQFDPYLTGHPDTTISILETSVTNSFFDPQLTQISTINYYLSQNANVTIRIYDWPSQTLVRTLINNQPRSVGTNAEIFDGKNDANQILSEGIYVYKITAQIGAKTGSHDPVFSPGLGSPAFNVSVTPSGTFSPFKGDRLKIQYDLINPSLVSISLEGQPNFVTLKPHDLTGNTDYWDGRDKNGNIVALENPANIYVTTQNLPVNLIVVQNDPTVDVPLLTANPFAIRPVYNEIAEIIYTINQTSDVTVKILSQDGSQILRTLETASSKSAGTYTLIWDGKKSAGQTVTEAGDYRIRVEASNPTGGTQVRDGNIRVLF